MEKILSEVKDVDLKILSELDDESLLTFCKLNVENKYVYKLCNDENFWRQRTLSRLGQVEKNVTRTWKHFYLLVVHYNNKYQNNAEQILKSLSKKGMKNLDLINYFLSKYVSSQILFSFIYEAAKYGHLDLVKYYLQEARKTVDEDDYQDVLGHAAAGAAESGDEKILRYVISRGFDDFNYALYSAAEFGQTDIVNYLISLGADDFEGALINAAKGGYRNLVNFFIRRGADNWYSSLFAAAEGGHRDLMNFFFEKLGGTSALYEKKRGGYYLLYDSIKGGHMDIIKYVISLLNLEEVQKVVKGAVTAGLITKEKGEEIIDLKKQAEQ